MFRNSNRFHAFTIVVDTGIFCGTINYQIEEDFTIKSYAKINIHLEILNRRVDNYHNLFSLMAELDLYDLLKLEYSDLSKSSGETTVEILNGGGEFASIIDGIPEDKNLISIAVKKYMSELGLGGNFVFSLIKNIPSGAGLGGGSSNAATALRIVSETLGRDFDDILLNAASSTGSDIPFFLKGGFAFVEGRGELVSPFDFIDNSFILLINNGIHVNTGSAYESLHKPASDMIFDCTVKKSLIKERISLKSQWKAIFGNDFEATVFTSHPQIEQYKENLYNSGAFFSAMSGSGSTVFGLYESEENAKKAKKNLEMSGNRVYLTKFRSLKN